MKPDGAQFSDRQVYRYMNRGLFERDKMMFKPMALDGGRWPGVERLGRELMICPNKKSWNIMVYITNLNGETHDFYGHVQ